MRGIFFRTRNNETNTFLCVFTNVLLQFLFVDFVSGLFVHVACSLPHFAGLFINIYSIYRVCANCSLLNGSYVYDMYFICIIISMYHIYKFEIRVRVFREISLYGYRFATILGINV